MKRMPKPTLTSISKTFATFLFVAIVVTGLAAPIGWEAPDPANASTTTLISQPTLSELSASANAAAFPSGNVAAVLVPNQPSILLAQGAALAAQQGVPLVVSESGTSAMDAITKLSALQVSQVTVIGRAESFSPSFLASLGAIVTISSNTAIDDDLSRSIAIASIATFDHLVVVDTTHPDEVAVGVNYATLDGDALILTDGTQLGSQQLEDFFSLYDGKTKTLIGSTQPLGSLIPEEELEYTDYVDTADLSQATQDIASRVVDYGNTANDVYAAPSDQLGSIAVAGFLANQKRAVSLIAGTMAAIDSSSSLDSYLKLWASETAGFHLVGIGVTSAQAAAAALPTTVPRAASPTFRPTGVIPGASTWSLSYELVPGAASYAAYDVYGTDLANSTTSTIVVPNPMTAIALVAFDTAGAEIKRFDFRINSYGGVGSPDQESAVMSSTNGGTNYLQFLGSVKTPRFITRIMTDPFSMEDTAQVTLLGITCDESFVDPGQDATKQYEYDVQTMSGAPNRACDASASQNPVPTATIQAAQVYVPPTSFPSLAMMAKMVNATKQDVAEASTALAAAPTATDVGMMNATGRTSAKSRIREQMAGLKSSGASLNKSATATTLPDYLIRYVGFIPEALVPVPGYPTFDLFHPQTAVAGDGRSENGYDPTGSHRFKVGIKMNFSNHTVVIDRHFGESIRYNCTIFFGSCVVAERKTAPISEIQLVSSSINSTSATVHLVTAATIPVLLVAPAINSDLTIHLSAGSSYIVGTHDRMPVHEIYDGPQYSEFFIPPAYHSKGHFVPCLFSVGSACIVKVNVHP